MPKSRGKQVVAGEGLPPAKGPYSVAVRAGDLVSAGCTGGSRCVTQASWMDGRRGLLSGFGII